MPVPSSLTVLSDKEQKFNAWHAKLSLGFENRQATTYLTDRSHYGPLLVQRPFYPEGPVCHVYLIHPPGGVIGGDELEIKIDCREDSEVLITTPSAAKFYRSNGKTAYQDVLLKVAGNAVLEWLPQETLLFKGAKVASSLRIELAENARFFGWEMVSFGRPACDEIFSADAAQITIGIYSNGKPRLIEQITVESAMLDSLCGLGGHALMASLLAYPAGRAELEKACAIADQYRFFGATLINGVLVGRMLGEQAEPVRKVFTLIWEALRPGFNNRRACKPRIWAT
ncbi:Urease accessory protein UreD [Candidatus Methylobacter favarea]|uniref:Urease accessory protein UreD n=1 Tax=Candidatus Methylobacter favarea TaxID=2707345 RepID=A0A8S0W9S7_9GAMM|nr:urease accessory protein UreD [Candidatus Methylobacter favarea]CAA9890196.1 Urease accessory protein UreD [Candidatus Methylobacter favarea]